MVSDGFRSASILLSHPQADRSREHLRRYQLPQRGRSAQSWCEERGRISNVGFRRRVAKPSSAALALFAFQIYSGFSGGGKTRRYPYGSGYSPAFCFLAGSLYHPAKAGQATPEVQRLGLAGLSE
jgi:hypothetical protein